MVKFKLNISTKEGKTTSVEVDEPVSSVLLGKKVGDVIDGSLLNLQHKKLKITGGSDTSGFPLRPDVSGGMKKRILIAGGVGLRKIKRKGFRKRKMVRGNTITRDTYQINLLALE